MISVEGLLEDKQKIILNEKELKQFLNGVKLSFDLK